MSRQRSLFDRVPGENRSRGPYLEDARDEVLAKLDEGIRCPCCGQLAKRYRRRLTSSMAYALILIERASRGHTPAPWIHVENHLKSLPGIPSSIRGDFPKLRYWGFLEQKPERRDDDSLRSGYWRITQSGRDFVRGNRRAFSHCLIYNGGFEGLVGREVTIREALGRGFNYSELMRGE